MHNLGFEPKRRKGFIHSAGLYMSIIHYIAANQIMVGVTGSSKKQLIEQLAERAAELTGLCQRSLFEIVIRRERLGSTAIGNGIAIPHAVHQDLTRIMGIIAVLTSPVDFNAQDRKPIDIVDRAYIIHDGTVLMEGTPDEVVQHSGVRQVYLGERFSI